MCKSEQLGKGLLEEKRKINYNEDSLKLVCVCVWCLCKCVSVCVCGYMCLFLEINVKR